MADRYYSANLGQDKTLVAETATTTAAADVEIRISGYPADAKGGQMAFLNAISLIRARIIEDTWPPA